MFKFARRKSMASVDPNVLPNPKPCFANSGDGESLTTKHSTDNGKCETSDKTSFESDVDESSQVQVATHPMTATFIKNVEENPACNSEISTGGNSQKSSENLDSENVCERGEDPERNSIFEPQSNRPLSTRAGNQESLVSPIELLQTQQAGIENDLQVTAILSSTNNSPSPKSNAESGSAENSVSYWKWGRLLINLCVRKSRTSWFNFKGYLYGCRSLNNLIDGLICYTICSILCLICLLVGINVEQHKDVPFCVVGVTIWCCLVSLTLERGFFTHWLDQKNSGRSSSGEEIYDYSLCSWHWCLCCNQEIQMSEKRRSYMHSRKESSTAFICEVSDVANIDSDECPQMKEVESEGILNSSFVDCSPPPTRTVKAVVHRSESPAERPLPGCDLGCEGACACPSLKKAQSEEIVVCARCGQNVPCACRRRKVTAC